MTPTTLQNDSELKADVRPPLDPPFSVPTPVTVISDLHLGHPASYLTDPEMLLPVIAGARTVIVNGDSCELLTLCRRDEARAKLARLQEICESRGIQLVLITGNHDPIVSSLHYLDLFGGAVFLTHGDALHPMVAPWSREGPIMWEERKRITRGKPEPETIDEFLLLTKRISLVASVYSPNIKRGIIARLEMLGRFAVKPWRIIRTLEYWGNVAHYSHRLQERFRPQAKLMLIGHTHRAGVWQTKDFTLVNTGSYQPLSQPLVVQLDENRAVVRKVILERDAYHIGEELHHFSLAGH